jgi:hypothetical protein
MRNKSRDAFTPLRSHHRAHIARLSSQVGSTKRGRAAVHQERYEVLNEEVLPDVGKETLEKYNIKVPVWQSAVHRWLGAVNIRRDWYM